MKFLQASTTPRQISVNSISEILLEVSIYCEILETCNKKCWNSFRKYSGGSFSNAQLLCKSINARLVTVRSTKEQKYLKSLGKTFWIGASSKTQWADQSFIEFPKWHPSVSGKTFLAEQCPRFFSLDGSWKTVLCSNALSTLCEKPLDNVTPTSDLPESSTAGVSNRIPNIEGRLDEILNLVRSGNEKMQRLEKRLRALESREDSRSNRESPLPWSGH